MARYRRGGTPLERFEAGEGKRSLIDKYSLLVFNKEIVQEHEKAWTAEDIITRGRAITKDIATIWPLG